MGKPYSKELDAFDDTIRWAGRQDVETLKLFLNRWRGHHGVIVGSGGSYSSALVAALFRELAHNSPTSPVTPLEFLSLVGRLAPRTLLLSAEGKNKDILAAAEAAASSDLASAVLTLTSVNPLLLLASESGAARTFAFDMDWVKDGYLATNSMLAMTLLLYRSFFGDNAFRDLLVYQLDSRRIASRRSALAVTGFFQRIGQGSLLVLYAASAKAFAVDLESKLSEAALATVQITDLRQFAHGRHLQLQLRSPTPGVVIAFAKSDRPLAEATAQLLPDPESSLMLELDGEREEDIAVGGLLDAMFVTEAVARRARHDPGQPVVPEFGRAIHALDPRFFLVARKTPDIVQLAMNRKSGNDALENSAEREDLRRAAESYRERLQVAKLKGLICDFDGTLCRAENRFNGMESAHVDQISKLARLGLSVAIASGRGDSLFSNLRTSIASDLHGAITVGYYSGSWISTLDQDFQQPEADPDFESLWQWLAKSSYAYLCKPLADMSHGGQFSIRHASPTACARVSTAIRGWILETGRTGWRVFWSGHSVDVLNGSTSKRNVVDYMAQHRGINSLTEILRIGDCGDEFGNDFELLNQGLSLSCDLVSTDLRSCWNFAAAGNNQTEAAMSYLRGLHRVGEFFRLSINLQQRRFALMDKP